jgi:hypothetical protein
MPGTQSFESTQEPVSKWPRPMLLHFLNFLAFFVWSLICYFSKASSWAPPAGYKKNYEPLFANFGPRTAPLFNVPSPKSGFCAGIYRIKLKLCVKFTVLIRYRTFEIDRSSLGSPKNGTPNHATTLQKIRLTLRSVSVSEFCPSICALASQTDWMTNRE